MYLNTVILTGYLGGDAESRTARPNSSEASTFVTLSLATKRTWKDRESGERQSLTTWHRCVIFNPRIADYAASLTKGAHVQLVGEIQTREYVAKDGAKKSVTEIRVQRIARLDRQAAAGSDEAMTTEVAEGAAA
jgi:single-strand DNA-binding protein